MAYYGRRRYRSWRSRRSYQLSKFSELHGLFGEVVGDIKAAFLALDDDALEELLSDYAELHGSSAGQYARKTYPSWKTARTALSGQTLERLVELVPPYLNAGQRMGLLQKLVVKYKANPPRRTVRIDTKEPEKGLAELHDVFSSLTIQDGLANLPERVMEAAKWLYDDDITAARAMLVEVEKLKNETMRASALREIELLKRTIGAKQIKSASYNVTLPAGIINVVVFKKSACFVATACFGQSAEETEFLRQFRDTRLLSTAAGVNFVVSYYKHGPALALLVELTPGAKWVTRRGLRILVWLLKRFFVGEASMWGTNNGR